MSLPPESAPADDAPIQYPETSPHEPKVRPWELELLISGAVVFSLVQLPPVVDGAFERALAHTGEGSFSAVFLLYTYVKLILFTLIGGFVLHLAMRAYWVGLIGLETVFPRGVNWRGVNYGPVVVETYRERVGRLQPHIDRADRFCSVLFPLAFTLVVVFLYSIVLVGGTSALALAISRVFLDGRGYDTTLLVLILSFGIVPMLTWAADRTLGPRVKPGSPTHRVLRRLAVATYYVNAMPVYGTVLLTLVSNTSKRARYPVIWGLMLLLFVAFFGSVLVREGVVRVGEVRYVPEDAGPYGVQAEHYENQRRRGELYDRVPAIQAEVVREPYVRLFIPYSARRHGEAFPDRCPGMRPLSRGAFLRLGTAPPPDSARVAAVLACWRRLQPVTLNGLEITPDFRFYTHPRTGIHGIVAHLPTAGLPRGENLLVVGPAPRTREDEAARRRRGRPPQPHYIPFWL